MEALILFIVIAFFAGLIARSLFATQRHPQVIYVQTEPVEHNGSGGCLPFILIGAVVLGVLLTVSGA